MSSTGAENLARHVKARREDELHASQLEIGDAGGPSNTLLTKIENGKLDALTPATAKKLDAGLRWEPGSAWRVWKGGEPEPLVTIDDREIVERVRYLSPEQREAVINLMRQFGRPPEPPKPRRERGA